MRRSVEVLHFLVETVSPSSMAQLHRMVSHQPFSALTHAPSPKVHKYPSSATFQALAAVLAIRDEALQDGPGCSRMLQDGPSPSPSPQLTAQRWVQRRATWGTFGEPWGTWILEMSSEAEIHAFQQALPGMRCFHQSVLVEVGLAPSSHSPTFRNPADFVDHPK